MKGISREMTKAHMNKWIRGILTVVACMMFAMTAKLSATAKENVTGSYANVIIPISFQDELTANGGQSKWLTGEGSGFGTSQPNYEYYLWSDRQGTTAPSGTVYTRYYKSIYRNQGDPDYDSDWASLTKYISTVSCGQLNVVNYFPLEDDTGKLYPLVLPGAFANYVGSGTGDDVLVLNAAIAQLKQEGVIKTQYTGDQVDLFRGDGCIDNVTFLIIGPNQGAFTSHKSVFSGNETLFGRNISNYNIITADALRNTGYVVAAHEFMHSLGLPDLYRTSGQGEPVGNWDLMAHTTPTAHYPSAVSRDNLGWLDIEEISANGTYTLQPATSTSGTRAFSFKTSKSSSEYFVVEYRQKNPNYDGKYERNIGGTGLVVYRVNSGLQYLTNAGGENYLYVYRPGTSSNHEAAAEMYDNGSGVQRNASEFAAVGPGCVRTTIGNSDLNADPTQNTIFYTNGKNSGVEIKNIVYNTDGSASFDITFPEISETTDWNTTGGIISGVNAMSLAADEQTGQMYVACLTGNWPAASTLKVAKRSADDENGAWQDVLTETGSSSGVPQLFFQNGMLHLLYLDNTSTLIYRNFNGSQWSAKKTIGVAGAFYNVYGMVFASSDTWIYYVENGNTLQFVSLTGKTMAPLSVSSATIGQPGVFVYRDQIYVLYSDYFSRTDKTARIACYTNGNWQIVKTVSAVDTARLSDACVANGIAQLAVVGDNGTGAYISFDGTTWTEEPLLQIPSLSTPRIMMKDGVTYILWLNGNNAYAIYRDGTQWIQMAGYICDDATDIDAEVLAGKIYVGSISSAGFTLRRMNTAAPVTPQTPVSSTKVELTIPTGYENTASVFIDGVEYTGTKQAAGTIQVEIGKETAQSAIMYQIDASGIPRGMTVWRLKYVTDHYTVTEIPEFKDLISYHGFSVRITGDSGIRCKSGISTVKKKQLMSATGLAGYRLTEIGTIVMRPDFRETYPLIKGGYATQGGKVYNGTTDKVYEVVNGVDRFTNVLVGLPESRYDTKYVFRSYIVLTKDGETITLYGAEVSRSIYDIAKVAVGTQTGSAQAFLQNIIDKVEGR